MYQFNYHRPASLDEAASLMAGADDGTYLSGGMTLIPTLKQRLAAPSDVIDLGGIGALSGITDNGNTISVGAMTRHAEVAASNAIPALAALAGQIGDAHVRNRGTIGGSIANSDPAADYPAAVVALDSTIHTTKRSIAWRGVLPGPLRDGAGRRRDHHLGGIHQAHLGGVCQVPQPGLPLRGGGRVRGPLRRRNLRGRDRRWPMRLPLVRTRSGARKRLLGISGGECGARPFGVQCRHPRFCGVSRPPSPSDGRAGDRNTA